tara:strand:- start:653 stop:892 length:240 start_codon:yes stop_codon:yes gene_type:complete
LKSSTVHPRVITTTAKRQARSRKERNDSHEKELQQGKKAEGSQNNNDMIEINNADQVLRIIKPKKNLVHRWMQNQSMEQ